MSAGAAAAGRGRRVEDERLLRGHARYVADLTRPRQLEAVFVRSPHPHAAVVGLDAAAARSAPGVAAVLTAGDLPHTPLRDAVRIEGLRSTPQPVLAAGRVRFVGEPVAMVLATTRAQAEDAAELVCVDWDPQSPLPDVAAAQGAGVPELHSDVPGNVLFHRRKRYGDPGGAFAAADLVVERRLHGNRYVAAPLETRACLAEPAAGRLTVWASTQGPHLLRRRLAQCTGEPEHRIRVIVPDVGGGFGLKIPAAPEEIAVALAARAVGRPVRWVESRRENLVAAPHAKEQHLTVALALAADGTFLAVRATAVGDAGAYSFNSASALIEPYLSAGLMPGPYRIEHADLEVTAVLTTKSPVCPYRGVGWTQGHTARELAVDAAARRLGREPADLRRQNLVRDFPYRSATGMLYDSGSYVAALDGALDRVHAADVRAEQAHWTPGRPRVGLGVTAYVEPTGWGSDGALQSEWSFASHDAVRLQVEPSGLVSAAVGTPTQGQGHATTLAAVVAAELGVPRAAVVVHSGDTDATPVSTAGTRASRVATVIGGALALAARRLRARLLEVAAALLDAPADALELRAGTVIGGPRKLTLREVAEAAYFDPSLRARVAEPELSVTQFHDPPATYASGAIAAVVEVDERTGRVRVRELGVTEDCGVALDPAVVEDQVVGAVTQGLGGALLEDAGYDATGRPRNDSLGTYLMPRATDVPDIEVGHLVSPSPFSVNGVKGMGESGAIAAPAAVLAAVEDALAAAGLEIEVLPLTAERVLEGLGVLDGVSVPA